MDWKEKKLRDVMNGDVVIADDSFMDYIENDERTHGYVASLPNPKQIGTKDKYIAWRKKRGANGNFKNISYSYPTSPNADKFANGCGCYVFSINDVALCAFSTFKLAEAYAETIEYIPYDKWTINYRKEKVTEQELDAEDMRRMSISPFQGY